MKKIIAKRRLKRCCSDCMTSFSKGSVYYKKRIVTEDEGIVFAYEYLICPKCKYKVEQHEKRYKEFQKRCNHQKSL